VCWRARLARLFSEPRGATPKEVQAMENTTQAAAHESQAGPFLADRTTTPTASAGDGCITEVAGLVAAAMLAGVTYEEAEDQVQEALLKELMRPGQRNPPRVAASGCD
jgi:hypothetical protein